MDNKQNMMPAPETPIAVKREKVREQFNVASPTDMFMSPCTARIEAAHRHEKPKGRNTLLKQAFRMPPRHLLAEKENTPAQVPEEKPSSQEYD